MADDNKRQPDDHEEHPDYPGLTKGEVRQAKERASAKIAKERKQEALDRIAEQEETNIRNAAGETKRTLRELENLSADNREMVQITLSLPLHMNAIRIDGQIFVDRGTFTVTRAKACEMMRIQFEGWKAESMRKGDDSYSFYAQMARDKNSIQVAPGIKSSAVINGSGMVTAGVAPQGTH